jgi:hypothetical protein
VNATKYYGDIVTSYNNFPTTFKKANPDLTSYVVGKTIDALFDQVAKEEANIRANPMARTYGFAEEGVWRKIRQGKYRSITGSYFREHTPI